MTSSAPFRHFAFAFGTAFAVLYVVALAKDLALFTVFPSLGIVLAGTHHSRDVADPAMGFLAPAMYWYGFVITSALGAAVVTGIAALIPDSLIDRVPWRSLTWLAPLGAIIYVAYVLLPYATKS